MSVSIIQTGDDTRESAAINAGPALTDVRVFGGGQAAVRTLRPAQTELEQLDIVAGDHAIAGRICGHQTVGGEAEW